MGTTQDNATKSYDELKKLRTDVLDAQKERDEHFKKLVKLTDELNQLKSEEERLRSTNVALAQDVARNKDLLRKLGYDASRSYPDVPPVVDGVILATPGAGLVEISIGSDQGLMKGHRLRSTAPAADRAPTSAASKWSKRVPIEQCARSTRSFKTAT